MYFSLGFVLGAVAGLAIAALVARRSYRRNIDLERRAQQNERLAELGTLTGGLAHEIKNPLSTMQLNLQLLLEDIRPDDPLHGRFANRIGSIQREASRLKEIVEDFLRFAGRMEVQPEDVDVNSLLEDLIDFLTPQAQLNRVDLRFRRTADDAHARVDPRLIKQAVLNLMLNGMQAMPDGGDLILSVSKDATHVAIQVTDTGKGMPEDVRQKIFQAYFSLRKGGTGLGLAMAKRIVDEHQGEISVCSEVGKGSSFAVRLPIAGPQR